MEEIVSAVIISWIASVVAFPVVPLQHWLNSRIRFLWRKFTFRSTGLTGRWLAVYQMHLSSGTNERRIETVKCSQLAGGEIRGSICAEGTNHTYKFLGRLVFDEFVAHYWATDESRDIGNFKFAMKQGDTILQGPLTLYDSINRETKSSIDYRWLRNPSWITQRLQPVRADRSQISKVGLFANRRFKIGEEIGILALGKVVEQGIHTIRFNDQHRLVKKPWRHLNHACTPNAKLDWGAKNIRLLTTSEILPQDEITFDYRLLPETISDHFDCRCEKCRNSATTERI